MKQIGWDVFQLRDLFHMSQWYRLHSCALLGLREADHPNMLPNTALGACFFCNAPVLFLVEIYMCRGLVGV